MCLFDQILVHLGPEESWIRVSLHEAVDFSLDFIEAGWRWILQALLGLLPGAVINVYLPEIRANTNVLKGDVYSHQIKITVTKTNKNKQKPKKTDQP